MTEQAPELLCDDCPPVGYPTDKTRCLPCPRRSKGVAGNIEEAAAVIERLRIALHRNACRYQPELSHDEINTEIERIVCGDEQRKSCP